MDPVAQPSPPAWIATLVLAVLAASVTIWAVVLVRCWRRRPVIRYQPRRPVPWGFLHVLLMLLLSVTLSGVVMTVARVVHRLVSPPPAAHVAAPEKVASPAATRRGEKTDHPSEKSDQPVEKTGHPIEKMVRGGHGSRWVILAAILAAVVAAPIAEEFFFRLLLQGWLEAVGRRHRRLLRLVWRFLPVAGPILLSSLLFGAVHLRVGTTEMPPVALVLADAIAKLAVVAVMVVFLRIESAATAADLGWAPEKLAGDVGLGLAAVLAAVPVVYLLQFCSQEMVNHLFGAGKVAADPLPLFFFALVLGTLYYRTHRIIPAIITHAAFNATTLALLWWSV